MGRGRTSGAAANASLAKLFGSGAKRRRRCIDLMGVRKGAWTSATGISVVVWTVSTGDRLVDRRDWAEKDRRFDIVISTIDQTSRKSEAGSTSDRA
jgi:hypothetical protein